MVKGPKRLDHFQPASPVCRNTPERFEEWQSIPVAYEPVDPRWEIRRATLSDFQRIFDLVDSSFETKRPARSTIGCIAAIRAGSLVAG